MKSKFLKTLLAACLACASVIGLAACGGGGGGEGGSGGGGGGGVINEGKQLNYVLLDDGTYSVTSTNGSDKFDANTSAALLNNSKTAMHPANTRFFVLNFMPRSPLLVLLLCIRNLLYLF